MWSWAMPLVGVDDYLTFDSTVQLLSASNGAEAEAKFSDASEHVFAVEVYFKLFLGRT